MNSLTSLMNSDYGWFLLLSTGKGELFYFLDILSKVIFVAEGKGNLIFVSTWHVLGVSQGSLLSHLILPCLVDNIIPIYIWEKWGSENLNNHLKVHSCWVGSGVKTYRVGHQRPCPFPLLCYLHCHRDTNFIPFHIEWLCPKEFNFFEPL